MKRNLTYNELMALAKHEYNRGGDGVYECWDLAMYDRMIKMFKSFTYRNAMQMFKRDFEIEQEERAYLRTLEEEVG